MAALESELERRLGRDAVIASPDALLAWECDGFTVHRSRPRAVVLPTTTAQVQAAVTSLLQEQHFSVLRSTPNSTERTLEVFAETGTDFDVEVLASSIQAAVPDARVRIRTS